MEGNTIPISEKTTVIVKASGDLFLEGHEPAEVRFQSSEDRVRVNQSNETLYVETHASLDLMVPFNTRVIVEKVGGSALLQDLRGELVIQKVGGDLGLQRVGDVRIEKVGGSCLIHDVNGPLQIQKVGGDLTVRAASSLQLGMVGGTGDFLLAGASVVQARAGGDIRLYVTEGLADASSVRAGGSVQLWLPSNARGSFSLNSGGETIGLDLTRQAENNSRTVHARRYEFTLGESNASLEASAGGDIRISDAPAEPHAISEDLARREAAWKEARERRGSASWSGGFGFDRTSAWADMISRRAQEAARRAEQRANAAMRRTEEQIRKAAERDIPWPPAPGAPPAPPRPQPSRVSDEERMLVLQMLQENKITVEQADKLLAALEGRYSG